MATELSYFEGCVKHQPQPKSKTPTGPECADAFSGLGGWSDAGRTAGLRVRIAINHSEDAISWHRANHEETSHFLTDISELDWSTLNIDLSDGVLLASPACQGFSTAAAPARVGSGGVVSPNPSTIKAKHKSYRSTAWSIIQGAEELRPRVILVENVFDFAKWVLFDTWTEALKTLGYSLTVNYLDASEWGVPQQRKRVVVCAVLGASISLVSPGVQGPTIGDVLCNDDCPNNRWMPLHGRSERVKRIMREAQLQVGKRAMRNNVTDAKGRSMSDLFPTVTTNAGSQFLISSNNGRFMRTITPRELARAQSFHDSYAIPSNRALASRLIGNAAPPVMCAAVLEQVLQQM